VGRTIAAEQSAAAAQARLHFAIDHSLEGIALLDRAGRFTRLNPAFAALYGFDVAELTGRPWQTVFSPAWVSAIEQTILPILRQRFMAARETRTLNRHVETTAVRRGSPWAKFPF
jgi:PAS domain S-box-containing protein